MFFFLAPDAGTDVNRLTDSQCCLEVDAQGIFLVHTGTAEKVRILQSVVSEFDFTKVDSFSRRERQLFELLGDGRSMSDIADRMSVSVKTVETYRARIKVKIDVANGLQIVRLATEWKLLHRTDGKATTAEISAREPSVDGRP